MNVAGIGARKQHTESKEPEEGEKENVTPWENSQLWTQRDKKSEVQRYVDRREERKKWWKLKYYCKHVQTRTCHAIGARKQRTEPKEPEEGKREKVIPCERNGNRSRRTAH